MTKREQSLFRLSEEVVEWGQSNAVQSDWCWSQCVCVCGVCVCVCVCVWVVVVVVVVGGGGFRVSVREGRVLRVNAVQCRGLCGWAGVVNVLEGGERDTNDLLSCSHYRWRDAAQDALQAPYHTVMQLVRMLSMVPCRRCTWWGPGLGF